VICFAWHPFLDWQNLLMLLVSAKLVRPRTLRHDVFRQ